MQSRIFTLNRLGNDIFWRSSEQRVDGGSGPSMDSDRLLCLLPREDIPKDDVRRHQTWWQGFMSGKDYNRFDEI